MHRAMIHPASYESCRAAVDRAFELFPQEIARKKVVIKPNVLRSSTAEEHIVTHPSLLRAVVEKVEEMPPAALVVGDNPGLFSYGILPGAQKARLHQIAGTPESFHDVIVEVFRLRIPDLFIMDAVVGMEGNGPASPELREIGLILAAGNAVALDGVVAAMMGLDPGRLRFLQKTKALGLGDFDPQAIQINGEMQLLLDFKLPPLGDEAMVSTTTASPFDDEQRKERS